MFKNYWFIRKNTPEIIQRLENLGWLFFTYDENTTSKNECIGCFLADKTMDYSVDYCRTLNEDFVNKYLTNTDGVIDCGDNEPLFLAIAALQDDSDMDQWFVYQPTNEWYNCIYDNIVKAREEAREYYFSKWFYECRKATIPELIEHFIK